MSKKTLRFDKVEVNKKEFHVSKEPITLDLVNVNQTLISGNFEHSDKGFKYFIGYKDNDIVRPLCIILPQVSGFIKCFDNGEKDMSLMIEDDSVFGKYKEIWNKILKKVNIKFYSMPLHDEKYVKTKVKQFNGVINTNFWGEKVPKEGVHHTFIACLNIF